MGVAKLRVKIMMIWCFTSLSTLYKSYRDYEGITGLMKGSTVMSRTPFQVGLGPHYLKSGVLTAWPPTAVPIPLSLSTKFKY